MPICYSVSLGGACNPRSSAAASTRLLPVSADVFSAFGRIRRDEAARRAFRADRIEVWSNPETGSWTILSTRPDGISCLAAAGEGWADIVQGQPL